MCIVLDLSWRYIRYKIYDSELKLQVYDNVVIGKKIRHNVYGNFCC